MVDNFPWSPFVTHHDDPLTAAVRLISHNAPAGKAWIKIHVLGGFGSGINWSTHRQYQLSDNRYPTDATIPGNWIEEWTMKIMVYLGVDLIELLVILLVDQVDIRRQHPVHGTSCRLEDGGEICKHLFRLATDLRRDELARNVAPDLTCCVDHFLVDFRMVLQYLLVSYRV